MKTGSTPVSLSFKCQTTKHSTVKWSTGISSIHGDPVAHVQLTPFQHVSFLGKTRRKRVSSSYGGLRYETFAYYVVAIL